MKTQTSASRCPRCSRILFLTNDHKLPRHRVPMSAEKIAAKGYFGSVPLTGTGQPWCAGIGR